MKSKIDYKEISKLIDLLEKRNLSHFELEVEGLKINIGRNRTDQPVAEVRPILTPATDPMGDSAANPQSSEKDNDLTYVPSPMVGTFYRSSDPSSPPFVEAGDLVEKNQTLCIIEAMKLMNEIEADIAGVVAEVFVKNGKSVEYGQRLFAIKPK